jgi:ASC-1-like (ASCH) protein
MIHELKCWPEYFQKIRSGEKTFEVRKNDRNFQPLDHLLLKEWDPIDEQYTGRELKVWVPYILSNPVFVRDGYVIMTVLREWYAEDGAVKHYFK